MNRLRQTGRNLSKPPLIPIEFLARKPVMSDMHFDIL
jgi:hypothetical protein